VEQTPAPEVTAEPAESVSDSNRVGRSTLGVFLVLAALWCAGHVAYFWRSNRQLWGIDLDGPDGPLGGFGAFSALALPWNFSMGNSPPGELLQVTIVLALVFALGHLLLRAAQIYLPPLARHSMALVLGLGTSGVAFELLTMAGQLNQIGAWCLWGVLLVSAATLLMRRSGNPVARWWGSDRPEDTIDIIDRSEWPEHHSRTFFLRREPANNTPVTTALHGVGIALIAVVTLLTFWHAVLLPEGYWDSLILYLGYARMTFLAHAFPFKAEAQVGIGLGANYPHLYPLYGAMASTLFDHWSDLHQRVLAPLAGLAATVLLYETMRSAFRSSLVAVTAALLFRITPNAITYTTYASDYALSFLFAGALGLMVVYFARSRTRGALAVLFAIPAFAMHLNFLMLVLWGPAVLGAMIGLRRVAEPEAPPLVPTDESVPEYYAIDREVMNDPPIGPPISPDAPSPFGLFTRRAAWGMFAFFFLVGSTWMIRNTVLTGNPVYAFFPNIFTSSVRVNPEVLRSAELEWFRNGDGIARLAEIHADVRLDTRRDTADPSFTRAANLQDRLAMSWLFWTGFETGLVDVKNQTIHAGNWTDRIAVLAGAEADDTLRIEQWPHFYKMAPLFPGFLIPGFLIALVMLARGMRPSSTMRPEISALLASMLLFTVGLLAYMYLLADFYLYQIVLVVVPAAGLGALVVVAVEGTRGITRRVFGASFAVMLLAAAVVPGIAMSMMNFKINTTREIALQTFSQLTLDALRNPGMPKEIFYEIVYGPDVQMWDYLNDFLPDRAILTHENRHYVFDPRMRLVHLDDWEIQKGWNLPTPEETLAFLRGRGLRFYLRVPNESRHPVNARLGMDRVIEVGLATELFRSGENVLYALGEDDEPAVEARTTPDPESDGDLKMELEDD
jgi:hypothetical protein